MGPGEQDEFQLEHDVGVGDVEVVLEVCRWKECAKLENRCEKGTHTHIRDLTFRCMYSWPAATALWPSRIPSCAVVVSMSQGARSAGGRLWA